MASYGSTHLKSRRANWNSRNQVAADVRRLKLLNPKSEMISCGEAKNNRGKVKQYGLTFPGILPGGLSSGFFGHVSAQSAHCGRQDAAL